MNRDEALVAFLFKGEPVRKKEWDENKFVTFKNNSICGFKDGVLYNTIFGIITIFTEGEWEIHEPKETCTFNELFEKLGPGDWATRSDCKGGSVPTKHFIGQGGILSFWCGSSEMPVMIDKKLIKSTFTIHRAK